MCTDKEVDSRYVYTAIFALLKLNAVESICIIFYASNIYIYMYIYIHVNVIEHMIYILYLYIQQKRCQWVGLWI